MSLGRVGECDGDVDKCSVADGLMGDGNGDGGD
jgi:hypothetical protein